MREVFDRSRASNRAAVMPFLTGGDPDVGTTGRLIEAMDAVGAGVVEVGIPFSDPIADGPVIQESMSYALGHGTSVSGLMEAVAAVRPRVGLGLVAMVSYSIVYRYGLEAFVERSAAAGFDGFIFPDLSVEEADRTRAVVDRAGLALSLLVAPSTPLERAKRIAAASTGFVYVVARQGITGEQSALPPGLADRLAALRGATDAPLAVGFGVSTPEHAATIGAAADAVIVGSALVRRVAGLRGEPERAVAEAGAFVGSLVAAVGGGAGSVKGAGVEG